MKTLQGGYTATFGIVITASHVSQKGLACGVIAAFMQMTVAQYKTVGFKFQILFSGTNSIATLFTEHWSGDRWNSVITRRDFGSWTGSDLFQNVSAACVSILES